MGLGVCEEAPSGESDLYPEATGDALSCVAKSGVASPLLSAYESPAGSNCLSSSSQMSCLDHMLRSKAVRVPQGMADGGLCWERLGALDQVVLGSSVGNLVLSSVMAGMEVKKGGNPGAQDGWCH